MREFQTRALSALVLGSAVLFITWWDARSFALMCLLGGYILAKEWWGLTKHRSRWFILLGTVYIGSALAGLIYLREVHVHFVFLLFGLVWSSDIGGYLVGKWIGRHKIAPRISPGKSWEGLAGSFLFTFLTAYVAESIDQGLSNGHFVINFTFWEALFLSVFPVLGLIGDLFESSLKRHAGVKDSGSFIPGHGGLFDRVDALLPCAIIMAALIKLFFTMSFS